MTRTRIESRLNETTRTKICPKSELVQIQEGTHVVRPPKRPAMAPMVHHFPEAFSIRMAIAAGATAGPTKMPILMYTKPKPSPMNLRADFQKVRKNTAKPSKYDQSFLVLF